MFVDRHQRSCGEERLGDSRGRGAECRSEGLEEGSEVGSSSQRGGLAGSLALDESRDSSPIVCKNGKQILNVKHCQTM